MALETISNFLNSDHFASAAILTVGSTSTTLYCIFDSEYSTPATIGIIEVSSAEPRAVCQSSDVATAAVGSTFTVNSTTYYIKEIQPDSTGMTTLILSQDSI